MVIISPFLLPTFRVHHFRSAFLSALTSRFPAFFKFLKRKLEIHPKYYRDGRDAIAGRITLNQDDHLIHPRFCSAKPQMIKK